MKLSLFTEVQCPPAASAQERLDELLQQAERADVLGFRGLWLAEIHFQPEFSVLSAPYLVLAAIAQRTQRLRLGVAVNILPVHHPLHLAEAAATLDLLSHGRMEFALGRGHLHSRVYEGFGVDQDSSRAMIEEGLDLILAAWSGQPLKFEGTHYRVPEVLPSPRPVQDPRPPPYLATSSLDGVELAARRGLNLFLPIHTMPRQQVKEFSATYWEQLAAQGRPEDSERELGLLVPLYVAESTERARERARTGIMDYYRVISEVRGDYRSWLARRGLELGRYSSSAYLEGLDFDQVCAEHAVVGDPELVLGALTRLAQETRAQHVLCWMNIGSVPHELVLQSMELFARQVLPRLSQTP